MKPATFHPTPIDQLPQDPRRRHPGPFKTLEHDEHTFPQAIEAKDAAGRTCVYVPLKRGGKIGEWR